MFIILFILAWIIIGDVVALAIVDLADKPEVRISTTVLTIIFWPLAIIFILRIVYIHLNSQKNHK